MSAEVLFEPFRYKSLDLRSRLVMAPMTRGKSPEGFVNDEVAGYYRRRAEAGVGLIITEGTGVNRPAALNGPAIPRFHGERELSGWKSVVCGVHDAGGLIAPQLWHVGAVATRHSQWTPTGPYESPSGLASSDTSLGQAMSDADVADTIQAFATAAADAKSLGFDAVELHAAHGYLIDQFFWGETNRRADAFGGATLAERSRLAGDILKAVRAAVGPSFPIIIRISQWKQQDYGAKLAHTPAELESWLSVLVEAGADILHCSQRRFWEPEFEGSDLNFAGWAKKVSGAPTITVGSVGLNGEFIGAFRGQTSSVAPIDELVRRLERGDFDLVAVGRALLQDPQWAAKVKGGRLNELSSFDPKALESLS